MYSGLRRKTAGAFRISCRARDLFRCSDIYNTVHTNFSPRIALTYSPFTFHGLHTVVRAGYGIYYVDSPLDVLVGQQYNFTNSTPGLATNPINGLGRYSNSLLNWPGDSDPAQCSDLRDEHERGARVDSQPDRG